MDTKEFIARWEAFEVRERARAQAAGVPDVADGFRLVRANRGIMGLTFFPQAAARFLVEAGLPESCAPYLAFDAVAQGPLPIVQYYGAHQFRPADISRLEFYYVIGSEASGNPICLDAARDGEILLLDHENRFRPWTFVASSVATLAEALLILHTLPRADFRTHLLSCDPKAAAESAFLPNEVAMLEATRAALSRQKR